MSPRRRRTSPASSPLLDNEDILGEILLRLAPQPSCLPRASLVCKRWRRLVSEPWFLRRFRAHHREPPLLGFFEHRIGVSPRPRGRIDVAFTSLLDPPDRIPPQRFSLERAAAAAGRNAELLGCRHGRVLVSTRYDDKFSVFVCDPVTGGHIRITAPPEFTNQFVNGAVLCSATDQGHLHGACHWSPFKVVLVSMSTGERPPRPMACVYSSETGTWGNIVWDDPCHIVEFTRPSVLIAPSLYWKISFGSQEDEDEDDYNVEPDGILEFNMERRSLTVMKGPPVKPWNSPQIVKTTDGVVGLATLSYPITLNIWHRNVSSNGVATWVLSQTFDLNNILVLHEQYSGPMPRRREHIVGYVEDEDVIFVCVHSSLFMVQLKSLQVKRHYERIERKYPMMCHPFKSFYTAGDSPCPWFSLL